MLEHLKKLGESYRTSLTCPIGMGVCLLHDSTIRQGYFVMNDNPGNGYGSDRATDKERDPNSSSPSGMRARLRQPFFI
ncbi:MAG TPA: hypothetical protein VF427_04565, partial [Noviherbaspirillum sp.]